LPLARADINSKKPPKAAWEMVTVLKDEGGLGVINLRKHNKALLLMDFSTIGISPGFPWSRKKILS
jgi:hypothetical protein